MTKELKARLNRLDKERDVSVDEKLIIREIGANGKCLDIEIDGRGILAASLQGLVKELDENKSLNNVDYELTVKFKSY